MRVWIITNPAGGWDSLVVEVYDSKEKANKELEKINKDRDPECNLDWFEVK